MTKKAFVQAYPYGEPNPNCPAERNLPWFLITGGAGISFLLLARIAINKFTSCVAGSMKCCHHMVLYITDLSFEVFSVLRT